MRAVVRQMALGTSGSNPVVIVTTMDVVIVRTLEELHTVASHAELRIGGSSYPFVGDDPADKWQDHKGDNAACNNKYKNLPLS